jgi:hypothetical protein
MALHGLMHGKKKNKKKVNCKNGTCLGAVGARGDHVGLEDGALEEDLVVVERLVDGGEDALGGGGAGVDVVPAVGEDLGLDDGDEAVLLADQRVPGEALGVQLDRELGRLAGGTDL